MQCDIDHDEAHIVVDVHIMIGDTLVYERTGDDSVPLADFPVQLHEADWNEKATLNNDVSKNGSPLILSKISREYFLKRSIFCWLPFALVRNYDCVRSVCIMYTVDVPITTALRTRFDPWTTVWSLLLHGNGGMDIYTELMWLELDTLPYINITRTEAKTVMKCEIKLWKLLVFANITHSLDRPVKECVYWHR